MQPVKNEWWDAGVIICLEQTANVLHMVQVIKYHCHPIISTTTVLRPFVRDYPGELVPEETFTYSHLLWASIILYLLPPSIAIYGIFSVQFTCLTVFFAQSLSKFSLVYPLYTPYISSSNNCLLFAAHGHTIATCFAVVQRLYHLIVVSLSVLYLEPYLLV